MASSGKEMSLAIKIAGKVESSFSSALSTAGSGIANLAGSIATATVAASAAVGTIAVAAVNAGIEYESAFAGVKKTVEEVYDETGNLVYGYEELDAGIRQMALNMPTSATEIAGVAEAAGQLGIQTENILGFTETMVMLGDATNMSAEDAATTLAKFANITGMSQDNFDNLGSTLVALGNNYATTESDIANMAMNLASAGSQVGMSESDILALAASLSSVGLEAQAGGSAFSKALINMQLAVETNSDSLKDWADVAGMSTDEFSTMFKEDATGALQAFIKGLSECGGETDSAIKVLDEMGITETRLRDALLRSAGASDVFTSAIELGSEAWDENTALANEAEQRYATMESQIDILKNGLTNLGIEFYQSVRNPIADVVKTANGWISTMTEAFQANGLTGLVESLGGILSEAVVMIADYAPTLIKSGINLVKNFVTGIVNNSGTIADAAAEVGTLFINGLFDLIPQVILAGIDIILELASSINDQLPTLISNGTQAIVNFVSGIISRLPNIISTALTLVQTLVNSIGANAPMLLSSAVELIATLLLGIIGMLPTILQMGIQLILSLVEGFVSNLPMILQMAVEVIVSFINGLVAMLPYIIQGGIQLIISLLQGIIDNLPSIIQAAVEIVMALVSGLLEAIPQLIAAIPELISAIVDTLFNTDWLQVGADILNSIIDGILSMAGELGNFIKDSVLSLLGLGGGEDTQATAAGRSTAESYTDGMSSFSESTKNMANKMSSQAFEEVDVTSAASAGAVSGEAYVTGITDSIAGVPLDFTNLGLDNTLAETLGDAGVESGMAFSSSLSESLNTSAIDFSGLAIDTEGLTADFSSAGFAGTEALSLGISNNTGAVTMAATTLTSEVNTTLDSGWSTTEDQAESAMSSLAEMVKSKAQEAAQAIKSAFENLTITIPKPKIPVISTSYRTEAYGDGGSVSIPQFAVNWNALGGIFDHPTILSTASHGLQGTGEAGPEALLPLDTLWTQMRTILTDILQRNSGMSIIDALVSRLQGIGSGGSGGGGTPELVGAGGPNIAYAPVYNLYGTATKEDVIEADKLSQVEFAKMMKQWQKDNDRIKF